MDESRVRRSVLRRTARGAVARTSLFVEGLVEEQVSGTARAVVDDLEPYLATDFVPRLVEALLPDLVDRIVPDVLDGVTAHLAATTVPQVVDQATPVLADEVLPALIDRLEPYLAEQLAPRLVDALTPHVAAVTAPRVVDALLPKIRAEIVPVLLEDVVVDPRVRDLIRQQSFGLAVDGFESFRRLLAAWDDRVEAALCRLRRSPVPEDVRPDEILPGRTRSHAGVVTRGVGYAIDVAVIGFVAGQGLAAVLATVEAVLGSLPAWVTVAAAASAVAVGPLYFGLAWWLVGRTVGATVSGHRVCRADGQRPGFLQSAVRAVAGLLLLLLWILGALHTTIDADRRGWLDLATGTRTPYRSSAAIAVPVQRPPGGQ